MSPRRALTPPCIAVGSRNPVKVAAVTAVVRQWHASARIEALAVPSGVPDQPLGDEETRRGALARARAARDAIDADIGVGLEGGVVDDDATGMRTCAWAAIVLRDGREFTGGSLAMPLPPAVATLVRQGLELGHAMDAVTGAHNTKHGAGAVGILTSGLVDRQQAYEILVTYAFSPLLAADYWAGADSPSAARQA